MSAPRTYDYAVARGRTPEDAVIEANSLWHSKAKMARYAGQPWQIDSEYCLALTDPELGTLYFVIVIRFSKLDVAR
jgi:hypothetical protein